jgi:hypothetical protein
MASLRMTLLDLLNKSEQGADPNFLRDGVQLLAQELMDAEVTDLVGAEPHQRSADGRPTATAIATGSRGLGRGVRLRETELSAGGHPRRADMGDRRGQ